MLLKGIKLPKNVQSQVLFNTYILMMCSVLHVKPAMSLPVPVIFHQYLQNASWAHLYFVGEKQNEQTLANCYNNSIREEKHVNGRETGKKRCMQHAEKNGRKGGLRNRS